MTPQIPPSPSPFPAPPSRARRRPHLHGLHGLHDVRDGRDARTARDACRRHARHPPGPALCAALLCAGTLWADASAARTPRPPRAASTPSTAQILAPSTATVPDALPTDALIYRCGNTYSAHACGAARPLDVQDARSDAQRRQSQELTLRAQRMAAWLEAERHGREAGASAPRRPVGASAATACVDKPGRHCKPKAPPQRRVVTTPATGSSAPLAAQR